MSEKLLTTQFNNLSIPDEIGNITVNEMMNLSDAEVIKKGNKLSIRNRFEHGVATLEFYFFDSESHEMKTTSSLCHELKKELKDDIVLMKKSGMLQKDIAFELDISESYVSNLIRKSDK